jgi:quercetin dioxygenase-like cupin family protein/DNA-binding XRE family transcriptional regulator
MFKPILAFRSGPISLGHDLILEKNSFTVKKRGKVTFPSRKFPAQTGIQRKTSFTMLSDTITTGLQKYSIGSKLRRLRLRKSMGLVELGQHTGLSPALLSKLERDVMHPTLPTLLRISMVFSVGLEYFFNPEPRPVLEIVRKQERLRFPDSANASPVAYYFESLDFPVPERSLDAYLAEFEAEQSRPHEHAGIEFMYVISGKLELHAGGEPHELAEGDAVYFDSGIPHAYRRVGGRRTTALVVTLPLPSSAAKSS